jgi:hypothetical protein
VAFFEAPRTLGAEFGYRSRYPPQRIATGANSGRRAAFSASAGAEHGGVPSGQDQSTSLLFFPMSTTTVEFELEDPATR